MKLIESDETELIFEVITETEPDSRIIRKSINQSINHHFIAT